MKPSVLIFVYQTVVYTVEYFTFFIESFHIFLADYAIPPPPPLPPTSNENLYEMSSKVKADEDILDCF